MSWLTLVRHAQASFDAAEYDQLSPLGELQARMLGAYWARRGVIFDAVCTGPRRRQRQTAALASDACRAAGLAWPEPMVLAELDEYHLQGILQQLAPELVQRDEAFAVLVQRWRDSTTEERGRHFQRMFEPLLAYWMSGATVVEDVEGWPAFQARVQRGLARLQDPAGQGRRVAAVTSGGFIGTAVQLTLDAPHRTALELSWRLRNGSLTEFVFTPGRCSLDAFNTLPYLEDPALWTYR